MTKANVDFMEGKILPCGALETNHEEYFFHAGTRNLE